MISHWLAAPDCRPDCLPVGGPDVSFCPVCLPRLAAAAGDDLWHSLQYAPSEKMIFLLRISTSEAARSPASEEAVTPTRLRHDERHKDKRYGASAAAAPKEESIAAPAEA